ncbi:MAG: TRAP transporter small permease [Chloroflexi bacterium]|nr:TRAP transporter small permease [Chloroflexota bacterium]
MDWFNKLLGRANWVGNIIASIFLAGIALLMGAEIVARYVFNRPIPGTWEIVGGSMAVLTTIGFAFALTEGSHIRVDIALQKLSPEVKHRMLLGAYFVGFLVTAILCWQLVLAARYSISIREYTMGLVRVPVYVTRSIFIFSALLFCLAFLQLFIKGLMKDTGRKERQPHETDKAGEAQPPTWILPG